MIHYHGVWFSGGHLAQQALAGRHAMVSFAAPGPLAQVAEICQSFTLDNGAYSAWKTGATYDVEGFVEWVKEWRQHPGFDWYVMPDVIDGDEADNLAMRGKWMSLCGDARIWAQGVPVWHLHESIGTLAQMVNAFPRLALGSSGQYAEIGTESWWQRMAEAMSVICDENGRPKTRLHGLRMLDTRLFSALPFASADSTNVARNIGLDQRWHGPYVPASQTVRALVIMDRIESHAAASVWAGHGWHDQMRLFG